MAIKSLDEVLVLVIEWEKDLQRFYADLETSLHSEESRVIVQSLRRRLDKVLYVLENINVTDYRHVELIKNVPDYRSEHIIPNVEIDQSAGPKEILEKILTFEEKLEEFYQRVLSILVYTKSKELFAMLVQFKFGQIKEIRRLMDGHTP